MAYPADNGDISSIQILGKFNIGGGGGSLTGVKQNNKVAVWGRITGKWADTTGLILSERGGCQALGLSSCDVIQFDVVSVNGVYSIEAGLWTADAIRNSAGDDLTGVLVEIDASTNPTAGHVCIVNFLAFGNSNEAPSLT